VVNGFGLVFFSKVATWKGEDVSRLLPLVFVMMTLVTVAASVVFLHEPLTSKKLVGVALACAAMWFLN
jgi:drug/metabolite transporter (DMT)-like permease